MPTYLISKSEFSTYVDVTDHIDEKYLQRFILRAQELFLAPLMGDELYQELLEDKSSGYYGTGMLSLLTDYVLPYLVYKSYQLYLPTSGIFMTGQGPRTLVEEHSELIPDDVMKVLVNDARNSAEAYGRKLYNFLCQNKDTYTAFRDSDTKHFTANLPKVTGVGNKSRRRKLEDGFLSYNKEKD